MVRYKALPFTDLDRHRVGLKSELPIADVFLSALEFVRQNIKDSRFMENLKSNLGCSFDAVLLYTTHRKDTISLWSELNVFRIVNEETGETMGYTIEPFIELLTLVKSWRKEHKNNKTMKETKEKINPIHFKESNRTLKGGENADDLRVFSDGVVSVSCWKLTFLGVLKILFTRKIWLGVLSGNSQPPVWMSTDFPFKSH